MKRNLLELLNKNDLIDLIELRDETIEELKVKLSNCDTTWKTIVDDKNKDINKLWKEINNLRNNRQALIEMKEKVEEVNRKNIEFFKYKFVEYKNLVVDTLKEWFNKEGFDVNDFEELYEILLRESEDGTETKNKKN